MVAVALKEKLEVWHDCKRRPCISIAHEQRYIVTVKVKRRGIDGSYAGVRHLIKPRVNVRCRISIVGIGPQGHTIAVLYFCAERAAMRGSIADLTKRSNKSILIDVLIEGMLRTCACGVSRIPRVEMRTSADCTGAPMDMYSHLVHSANIIWNPRSGSRRIRLENAKRRGLFLINDESSVGVGSVR